MSLQTIVERQPWWKPFPLIHVKVRTARATGLHSHGESASARMGGRYRRPDHMKVQRPETVGNCFHLPLCITKLVWAKM